MGTTAKKVSVIPAKVQFDTSIKLSDKMLKVAAYCRVSTDEEEQDSSYEAQVEYYTNKIQDNPNLEFPYFYPHFSAFTGSAINNFQKITKI